MGPQQFDYTNPGGSPTSGFPPGVPPHAAPPSWWKRNRLWVIPVGCLGGLAIAGAILAFVSAIVIGVFTLIRSSEPYQQGVAAAKASPSVQSALGIPVEEDWYVLGKHQENGPTGASELQVPLHGPSGKGTLYISARKSAGRWRFTVLEFEDSATKKRVDLLSDQLPGAP